MEKSRMWEHPDHLSTGIQQVVGSPLPGCPSILRGCYFDWSLNPMTNVSLQLLRALRGPAKLQHCEKNTFLPKQYLLILYLVLVGLGLLD